MKVYDYIKRFIDLVIALSAAIILSPIFFIVSIILRFSGEQEVFYRQPRIGYKNNTIYLWKFVTMRKDSEKQGTITMKNDYRVMPFGKILRKTKLNELPQIINVIKGDMTIVGPRPQTEECFNYYSEDVKKCIYNSKPGLTGLGSVFFRNEEVITAQSKKPYVQCYKEDVMVPKGALELWYLTNKSFFVDIKIIVLTVIVILIPKSTLPFKWFHDIKGICTMY